MNRLRVLAAMSGGWIPLLPQFHRRVTGKAA
jgi:hypothetical protein